MKAEEIKELFEETCTRYGFADGEKEFYKKTEVLKTATAIVNHILSNTKDQTEEEKWISVEDRLPETGIPVIIYGINDYGKGRRLRAFYAPKFSIDADSYEGDADYSEEKNEYFIPEGWYEQNEYEDTNWYVGFKPTHWQPLPTPPKE